ncbi:MAG TPA: NAD(P)H-dependent oxidoreductase subunit E [Sideroxyarcus sp.]|nr:NAD(P)H-dependent oxidoreductase subunit E [Sideroxyarcus sp.]
MKELTFGSGRADATTRLHSVIAHAHSQSAHLLHVLQAVQQQFHHIPAEAIAEVAAQLKLPFGQVEGVADFYSFFRREKSGRYDILFSNCTSCGSRDLMTGLCERLGVAPGQTRADGLVSIAETSCIGMCDHGAAMLVNGVPLARIDGAGINRIAAQIEAGAPLVTWPAEWFEVKDHVRKSGLLLGDDFMPGQALRAMLTRGDEATLEEIVRSGLRGRGGAGFGTGMKWKLCREAKGEAHYVVCNADEGEPGTFKDRVLLHSHADRVFEGMTICAFLLGAERGLLYLRGEYRHLLLHLQAVLARRCEFFLLGENILGQPGFNFDIEIVVGAGAYICGEESALIESLEGKRGVPRVRPPFPVTQGYLGQPTVVNNVETFMAAANIVLHGGAWFAAAGTEKSAGSKVLSVSGDCARPGIYEYPFGVSVRQVLEDCGAQDTQAVQVGGPSGTLIGAAEFDRKLGFEDLSTGGSFMVYGAGRDMLSVIGNFAHFFAHESCGFCTPCRVGTTLLKEGVDKIAAGRGTQYDLDEMRRTAELVKRRSHCGLGQTAANPVLDGLQRFPQAFEKRLLQKQFEPFFEPDAALEKARQATGRHDAEAHLE